MSACRFGRAVAAEDAQRLGVEPVEGDREHGLDGVVGRDACGAGARTTGGHLGRGRGQAEADRGAGEDGGEHGTQGHAPNPNPARAV